MCTFQVFEDFKVYGGAVGLNSCCVYGGASYQPQEFALKRGVDIVVGTPGRIKVSFFSESYFDVLIVVEWYMHLNILCF